MGAGEEPELGLMTTAGGEVPVGVKVVLIVS